MTKTLLLTGARGLVGDAVLRHFRGAGWRVVAACSGAVRSTIDGVTAVPFDLAAVHGETLETAIAQVDAVVHCAALVPSVGQLATASGASEVYAKNVVGTYDLMATAARRGIRYFVFISTVNLFDTPPELISEDSHTSPPNAYLLSKLAGEAAADMFNRTSRTQYYCLRISAPYGARFSANAVIPTFVTRAIAGEPLELLGSGQRQQVFTYVDDIARACLAAVSADAPGIYNIAGPEPVTMAELAECVVRTVGGDVAIRFTGRPDPREGGRRRIALDRAKRGLGWQPLYDIDRGLAAMIEELRNPPEPILVQAAVRDRPC